MHGLYTVFTLINTKMKKLSLGLAMAAIATGAQAYWMPTPEITSEVSENGKTTIEWTYDDSEVCTYFQVIVYKMHKAQEDGRFVLASSDFSHIESEGTINNHQERGALWDYLPDNPGWWVRSPLYMGNAMGIDTFNYFAGSDNSDIFGGAYMVSPDYDLTNLSDKTVNVSASLAAEAAAYGPGTPTGLTRQTSTTSPSPPSTITTHSRPPISRQWRRLVRSPMLPTTQTPMRLTRSMAYAPSGRVSCSTGEVTLHTGSTTSRFQST